MGSTDTDDIVSLLDSSWDGPMESGPDLTPSRSDHFFHGTTEHLEPGDTVLPVSKMTGEQRADIEKRANRTGVGQQNTDRAWATADPMQATEYGRNVYQVTPNSESPNLHRSGHVSDREGLTVKNRVPLLDALDHPQAHRNRQ